MQQSEEMAMMTELSHLEGIITQLDKHTADPFSLPLSTEQVIVSFAYYDPTRQMLLLPPPFAYITPRLSRGAAEKFPRNGRTRRTSWNRVLICIRGPTSTARPLHLMTKEDLEKLLGIGGRGHVKNVNSQTQMYLTDSLISVLVF